MNVSPAGFFQNEADSLTTAHINVRNFSTTCHSREKKTVTT
jgi:hypothetical protein